MARFIRLSGAAGSRFTDGIIGGFSNAKLVVKFPNDQNGYNCSLYDKNKQRTDQYGFHLIERVVKLHCRDNWSG